MIAFPTLPLGDTPKPTLVAAIEHRWMELEAATAARPVVLEVHTVVDWANGVWVIARVDGREVWGAGSDAVDAASDLFREWRRTR